MNIHEEPFFWRYNDLDSYKEQLILAEFVKNNTNKDDYIGLIGWTGEIHFLSQRFMPDTYSHGNICDLELYKKNRRYHGEERVLQYNTSEKEILYKIYKNNLSEINFVMLNGKNFKSFIFGTKPDKVKMFVIYPYYLDRCNEFANTSLLDVFADWKNYTISGVNVYIRD
jgi:hypothetical protein